MREKINRNTITLMLMLVFFSSHAAAIQLTQGDYKHREDVEAFISKMVDKGLYTEQQLVDWFGQVKQQKRLFKKMNNAAERKLTWHRYRQIFITDKRISEGVKFYKKHEKLLNEISQQYGVPAEIIVAIIGVETYYGRIKGKDPVFDTLVTFAFDFPKRAKFFTSELEHFLALSNESKIDITQATGSYAGAMGMPQFISSSYRHYAVDHDKDGVTDLWNNHADIFASVANYFKKHGWKKDASVAYPLQIAKNAKPDELSTQLKPQYAYKELVRKGLKTEGARIAADETVSLIKLEQKDSTDYWAGLKNFYVITRYNHSEMYAMAVYQLSQEIRKKI